LLIVSDPVLFQRLSSHFSLPICDFSYECLLSLGGSSIFPSVQFSAFCDRYLEFLRVYSKISSVFEQISRAVCGSTRLYCDRWLSTVPFLPHQVVLEDISVFGRPSRNRLGFCATHHYGQFSFERLSRCLPFLVSFSGLSAVFLPASYTSVRCCCCGSLCTERFGVHHKDFHCFSCGLHSHADLNGSFCISLCLGL